MFTRFTGHSPPPQVNEIRDEELMFLKRKYTLTSFINFVFGCVPILVTLSSFGTFVAIDDKNVLTADKVYIYMRKGFTRFHIWHSIGQFFFPPGVCVHLPLQPAAAAHAPAALGNQVRDLPVEKKSSKLTFYSREIRYTGFT